MCHCMSGLNKNVWKTKQHRVIAAANRLVTICFSDSLGKCFCSMYLYWASLLCRYNYAWHNTYFSSWSNRDMNENPLKVKPERISWSPAAESETWSWFLLVTGPLGSSQRCNEEHLSLLPPCGHFDSICWLLLRPTPPLPNSRCSKIKTHKLAMWSMVEKKSLFPNPDQLDRARITSVEFPEKKQTFSLRNECHFLCHISWHIYSRFWWITLKLKQNCISFNQKILGLQEWHHPTYPITYVNLSA